MNAQVKIRKNDRHDVARNELILIRCGHHLWPRLKSLKRQNLSEESAIWEALETVWEAKRQVRAELKVKRAEAARLFTAKMRTKSRPQSIAQAA